MPLLQTDAPPLDNVETWINTAPIDLEEGTYLLYFWNYSCSCCRNRLEIFRRIHREYQDIKVIGVHTPQFGFEQDGANLENAVEKLDVCHPVGHDPESKVSNDYDIAYSNHALIVDNGSIVFQQTHKIEYQELVQKVSEIVGAQKDIEVPEADQIPPHEFFGYSKTSGLNEESNYPGEKDYQLPKNRKKGQIYLKGVWEQQDSYIESKKNSELRYSFNSSKLSLVIDPNGGVRDIKVLIDGEPVSEEYAGEDLRIENGESYIRVKHPDVYNLVDAESHEYEITLVPDDRTRFYALSCG